MNDEKVKIEFWRDEKGFAPVEYFFDNLTKSAILKIRKKLEFIASFNLDELLKYGDNLTLIAGHSKIEPRPYELKIKISPPIRIICYRKNNTLVFIDAVVGSLSNKRNLKKIIKIYKKRVC